jgi:hypothetical protein
MRKLIGPRELINKVKHVQERGNNLKYFHHIDNVKHRKKKIFR